MDSLPDQFIPFRILATIAKHKTILINTSQGPKLYYLSINNKEEIMQMAKFLEEKRLLQLQQEKSHDFDNEKDNF